VSKNVLACYYCLACFWMWFCHGIAERVTIPRLDAGANDRIGGEMIPRHHNIRRVMVRAEICFEGFGAVGGQGEVIELML
jgi:hypothetical protein